MPAANRAWWRAKLERNKERDRQAGEALTSAGWTAVRIWEHEDTSEAADRIERTVREARIQA